LNKTVKEIIITVALIVVLAVIVINNLKEGGKGKQVRKAREFRQAVEVLSPSGGVSADKKTLNLQKQRAETLAWGRDPFVYVEAEAGRGYRTSALELKGVSLGENKIGYAFINNEILKVGDTIGGYEVLQIQKDKVLLRKGNQSFYLTLPEE
jgi:hypothetical protein